MLNFCMPTGIRRPQVCSHVSSHVTNSWQQTLVRLHAACINKQAEKTAHSPTCCFQVIVVSMPDQAGQNVCNLVHALPQPVVHVLYSTMWAARLHNCCTRTCADDLYSQLTAAITRLKPHAKENTGAVCLHASCRTVKEDTEAFCFEGPCSST